MHEYRNIQVSQVQYRVKCHFKVNGDFTNIIVIIKIFSNQTAQELLNYYL